jgi:hypothetical protein
MRKKETPEPHTGPEAIGAESDTPVLPGKVRKPRTTPKGLVTSCQVRYDEAVLNQDVGAANEAVLEAILVLKNEYEKVFIHANRVATLKETWRKRYRPEA